MPGDDLQSLLRPGTQGQALQAFVASNGLGEPLEHGLGHRAGVDVLLPQNRRVNLPELQAVAEFQNPLGLDYGSRRLRFPLSRRSLRHFASSRRASSATQ